MIHFKQSHLIISHPFLFQISTPRTMTNPPQPFRRMVSRWGKTHTYNLWIPGT